ncbi:hypothetical protein EYF80_014115 [Liparis tanakae]|uniref:Uncharacterized protein n=1 Tax=Liparis tanakae TaxID=230148 RepID=A0A4Z2IEK1_9TELE|nr:hypothetical protein EYF80_014115 [Liparis tanakae]
MDNTLLYSNWESPAEERDWPSMSARRPLSSFSCRDGHTAGQQKPTCPRVVGQRAQACYSRHVLLGRSVLHELRAELINLVSAPGHSLQLHALQLVLEETSREPFVRRSERRRHAGLAKENRSMEPEFEHHRSFLLLLELLQLDEGLFERLLLFLRILQTQEKFPLMSQLGHVRQLCLARHQVLQTEFILKLRQLVLHFSDPCLCVLPVHTQLSQPAISVARGVPGAAYVPRDVHGEACPGLRPRLLCVEDGDNIWLASDTLHPDCHAILGGGLGLGPGLGPLLPPARVVEVIDEADLDTLSKARDRSVLGVKGRVRCDQIISDPADHRDSSTSSKGRSATHRQAVHITDRQQRTNQRTAYLAPPTYFYFLPVWAKRCEEVRTDGEP